MRICACLTISSKLIMVRSHRTTGYCHMGALACIALLLSGSIQYFSHMTNLSFVSLSYAEQQQKLQVDKDGINLSYAEQQQKLQVDKDGINLSYAEQQNAPRRVGH